MPAFKASVYKWICHHGLTHFPVLCYVTYHHFATYHHFVIYHRIICSFGCQYLHWRIMTQHCCQTLNSVTSLSPVTSPSLVETTDRLCLPRVSPMTIIWWGRKSGNESRLGVSNRNLWFSPAFKTVLWITQSPPCRRDLF